MIFGRRRGRRCTGQWEGRKLGSGPPVTYNRLFRSVDKILRSRGVPILPVSSGSSNSQIYKQLIPRHFGPTYKNFVKALAALLVLLAVAVPYVRSQETTSATTPQT